MTRVHRPGDRLGVFRLVGLLGRGGQGSVYRALDTERGCQVALKVLHGADEDIERIRREFRSLDGVQHPNIVPFFELGHHGDTTYYTMRLVEGTPLFEKPIAETVALADAPARRTSSRSSDETVDLDPGRWLGGLVGALERIHRSGLLHLDVKPSNLLRDENGNVLLVDFGLATRLESTNLRAQAPAQISVGYSSPEHLRQDHVSPSSDWFGVGATLFFALVGRAPTEVLAEECGRVAGTGRWGDLCAQLLSPDPVTRAGPSEIRAALGEPRFADPDATSAVSTAPTHRLDAEHLLDEIAARDGGHRIGVIHLSAPVGVHRHAEEATDRGSGRLDLRAICRQWERVPFGALNDLVLDSPLRSHLDTAETPYLSRMVLGTSETPASPSIPTRDHLRSAAREFADCLERSAAGSRPLLRIDEFQWCDLDSLAVLLDTLALSRAVRFDVLLTHRSSDSESPALTKLRRWLLSEPPGVSQREIGPYVEVTTGDTAVALPPLSTSEQSYLELCAVAGTRVSQHEIRLALPKTADELETLWSLRSKGLVTSSGPRLSDRVEASEACVARVRAGIPPGELHRLHLRLARSARRSPHGTAASLGFHYTQAGLPNLARRHLVAAARTARDTFAFELAASFYRSALSDASLPDSERSGLLIEAAHVLKQSGRGREAADAWIEAAASSSGADARASRLAAAEMLLTSGHHSEGRVLLRELAGEFGVGYPRSQLEALRRAGLGLLREYLLIGRERRARDADELARDRSRYCSIAFQGLMPVDPTRAAVFATEGVRWSRESGDGRALAGSILSLASGVLSPSGHRMRTWGSRMLSAAGAIAEGQGDRALKARVEIARSTMAFWEGEWAKALAVTDAARRLLGSSRVERAFDRNVLDLVRTRSLEELGCWHDAIAESSAMYADAVERNDVYASVTACLNLGMLALAKGEIVSARSWADRAVQLWPGRGMQVQHVYALRVHAHADLCQGDPAAAWERLESSWEAIRKGLHLRVTAGRVDVYVLRGRIAMSMLHRASDPRRWTREIEKSARILERIVRRDARAHGGLLRAALVARAHGPDDAHAMRAVGRAAALYRAVGMEAMASACECFVDPDPEEQRNRRLALEQSGIVDPGLWLRGFVPLGA